MFNEYYFIFSLLLLNYVSGGRISRDVEYKNADELDKSIIIATGCKYVYLAQNETVLFTKDSVQHTTMAALLADKTLLDQNQTTFKTNYAVRSASQLDVLMFSRRRHVDMPESADYQIQLGVQDNQKSYLYYMSQKYLEGLAGIKEAQTPNILSPEQYVKLYASIDPDTFKYGKPCEQNPIYTQSGTFSYYPLEIVQFGFLSHAENGAKILYDCPSNFAGCPANRIIY